MTDRLLFQWFLLEIGATAGSVRELIMKMAVAWPMMWYRLV